MLQKLNEKLNIEILEMREIEKQIKNLQAKKNRKNKKIEGIKFEIQTVGGGQKSLF